MAVSTLAKSPHSDRPYSDRLIEDLTEAVIQAEKPKPPQPATEPESIVEQERRLRG